MAPTGSGSDGSPCLSDEILVNLLEGRLATDALEGIHRHADMCGACRALLVAVVTGDDAPPRPARTHEPEPASTPPPEERPPDAPWVPPARFDEFRLERFLGRGAMGLVYLAHDTSLDRQVAIKFIASDHPEPWVRAYFETEARNVARPQHPNVVTVFRVGQVDERPYIVSEYVVGRNLAELPLPLPWRQALSLGVGLARGLAATHRQGVLHRDIKPSNVLVTDDGVVKLLDFGLAERFGDDTGGHSGPRLLAGTPRYMAPELHRGAPATPQSDLYALGLLLHELCTGDLPPNVLSRFRPEPTAPEPPCDGTPSPGLGDIDPDFAALIQRCLAPEPSERIASAEVLCDALERLERASASAPLAAGNPYRGLAPFEAEHRALFFGRDADIRAVLERLRRQSIVLVAGDSGCGKSSLCRAGVLPRAAVDVLDEGRELTTVTLSPGRRPLRALAAALAPVLGRKEAELLAALLDAPEGLGQALRDAHQGRRGLLLFIDQLEELITLAEPAQAARFAAILGELALPSTGVRVLLAVRGDFLTRVSALPGLGAEAEHALFILRPMPPEGIREAIVGPARGRGVVFESGALVQTLVASTANGAGSLPLLQFALAELWERRNPTHDRITRAALDEMGGVAGALSRHADGVLARLGPSEREAARRLLLQLVTGEDTRIERGEEELVGPSDTAARAALRALVAGRLVHARTSGQQPRYEIAHDSLIGSWGTLRNWLDDDIGHRAIRQRLELAAVEWQRLARTREALWGQRQLDETRPLGPDTLGPRERAFLLASRTALTRKRWGRRIAAGLVVLAVASSYGGLRLQAYLEDARFAAANLGKAREALAGCRELGQRASGRREEAMALFDGRAPPPSGDAPGSPGSDNPWSAAGRKWTEALALLEQADDACTRSVQSVERALERDVGREEAKGLLLEVTYERMLLAERFHQRRPRDEHRRRLEHLLDNAGESSEWRRRLSAPAKLELVTEPPGATVELERYVTVQGVRRREPVPGLGPLGPTPIAHVSLPEGSYVLRLRRPDRAPLELPLRLERGTREQVRVELPASVPPGYVYIPPGCFLSGSADPEEVREVLASPPMHRYCVEEGFVIGRTEVTFGDWLAYLDELPPQAPARRILEQPGFGASGSAAVSLRQEPSAGWMFSLHHSQALRATARAGESSLLYPSRTRRGTADWRRLPLSGVSAEDLKGYFSWLDRTGRLPGARLCDEHEWERAARGADDRVYPHGDRLSPDDANIDVTYDRKPEAFGPDMVGDHPESASPFGLVDMAGNAFEMTQPRTSELGGIVLRGGGWYYEGVMARIASRSPSDPTLRDARVGVRVCASLSPR
jgi:formylglycine-generating enzyme required for sulfatase activity